MAIKNKSGKLNALMLFVLVGLGFMAIIIMGIFVYGANLVDQTFSSFGDITLGGVNFTESYDNTLGLGINAFLNSADNYGLGLLLGMIALMVISSFIFHERQKVWIVAEFVILIVAFIFAVTIQGAYETVINSSTELLDVYSVDLINSSRFILNLHIIIPITWAFIVIISYGVFRKKESPFGDLGG